MCFDADVFYPLTFTEEVEREISVNNICGSLKESFANDKIIEMTEQIYTLSISHDVESVGHAKEARECAGEDQEPTNTTLRRSR